MKLNLGCSDRHIDGYVNVDIVPPADKICDLSQIWPWDDNSVDSILAHDIIEHLPDKIRTMNEIWRVLKPGGRIDIDIPTTDGRGAFQDPTHVSYWNRNSFYYYTDKDPHRERFGKAYGVVARFKVIESAETDYPDNITKLRIILEAVKLGIIK